MGRENKKAIKEYLLDENGVDEISAVLQEWLVKAKVQQKNITRFRLAAETILEDLCIRFDRELHVSLEMKRRFGATGFVIRYQSDEYNPNRNMETDGWSSDLLSNIGLMPTWSYLHGVNELEFKLSRNKLRSEIWLVLAFAAAVLLGLLKPVVPADVATFLSDYIFSSFSTVFMNLLGTFAGIMVFLSVIAGICGIGNVADFSKMGRYLIARNLFNSFFAGAVCAALIIPLFSFRFGEGGGTSQIAAVFDTILQIIPKDPVTPFLTGNILQIVFLAILIGVIIVILGSRTNALRDVIIQANAVALRLIDIVCRLLPLYVLSSLTLMFWESGMEIFRTIWKPLVICIVASAVFLIYKLLVVAIRCGVSPLKLFRKTLPGFLIGLTTASSTAAFGTVMEENEKALGINPQLSNFGFPIEMIITVSTTSCGFITIIYYLAEYNGVEVNPMWFISAWLLITIMTCAMPPISGGTLVCLGVLLAQFNISPTCLGLAGTLVLLCDFVMTATRIVISQMELVLEARHWDMLDYDKLRS